MLETIMYVAMEIKEAMNKWWLTKLFEQEEFAKQKGFVLYIRSA